MTALLAALAYALQTLLGLAACLGAVGIALVVASARFTREEEEARR